MLDVILTPQGHLHLTTLEGNSALAPEVEARLRPAFERGSGHGLFHLGAVEVATALPPAAAYFRDFATRYVTSVCGLPEAAAGGALSTIPPPGQHDLATIVTAAPPMTGAEYLTVELLAELWRGIESAFRTELAQSRLQVQDFLATKNPAWHLVGRVHFNLAENRLDTEAPFAFLATYTTQMSSRAKPQHLPLGQALRQYAGAANRPRLLSLLLPVHRAADQCAWLKAMVDSGEIYHPLRWTPPEAFQMLQDLPRLEASGVAVRVPRTWSANRPPRPKVSVTVGTKPPSGLGAEALLDFSMGVTLDGEALTPDEIKQLLAATDGLHLVRGRWVELDQEKLAGLLEEFRKVEAAAAKDGLSFAEAARLLSGANIGAADTLDNAADWSHVAAGPWLAETLDSLRHPDVLASLDPGRDLNTTLRPYQETGTRWLHLLSSLGLGACLADDMGLGKTVQVLALLLVLRRNPEAERRTSLIVAPASLLANWEAEIATHAPSLKAIVAHQSAMPLLELRALDATRVADADVVITSYTSLARLPSLLAIPWRLAVLDEAQAIKNPGARQTRVVKQLDARARIALTGTPVENRLGDLWSLFDFINPGLLGTGKEFTSFVKGLADRPVAPYAPLRALVQPYILRRLKTDKSVIPDLPDKTEVKAYCPLTKPQAALYQKAVNELARALERTDGIERRGIVLSFLMRFKQICNHPSQWLGDGSWAEEDSGKFGRLREIAAVIASRQEKALVFTQFREVTGPLSAFLESVYDAPGLVLHGGTPVRERRTLVERFQGDEEVPFMVLSLKAGGTGLNLTAASHVVHFDRWWNPAVENQATDRAFRIGQTKNVLVHKFLCRGTVEEKIDQLIDSKRQLSHDLLEGGADLLLTEMNNDELLKLVTLDLKAALDA
ncbi:MAG TPA: DEAD/DEAH box helicase [Vicinamibacterales bacterium]|nr:DEAD/DEAH box helicase [Vicinamibacterales bacterium]